MIKFYMNTLLYFCAPIMFIIATYLLFTTIYFINNSVSKEGEIFDYKITEIDTTTTHYRPIIKYKIDNQEYENLSLVTANYRIYKKNDKVKILINKDNYNEIRIDDFTELWEFTIYSYLIFLGFVVISILVKKTPYVIDK